jgi:hypothetical protein
MAPKKRKFETGGYPPNLTEDTVDGFQESEKE